MILAAALLVLVALGLFVVGLITGVTVWYWTCVAVSALAAVILFVTWRRTARANAGEPAAKPVRETPADRSAGGPPAPSDAEPADSSPTPPAPPEAAAEAPAETASEPAPVAATETADGGDPTAEDTDAGDLLLVVDMHDDVFVVDEHPRYHLADCRWLTGREAIPIPVDEARTEGFTPCGVCSPDRHLAQVARARKASAT